MEKKIKEILQIVTIPSHFSPFPCSQPHPCPVFAHPTPRAPSKWHSNAFIPGAAQHLPTGYGLASLQTPESAPLLVPLALPPDYSDVYREWFPCLGLHSAMCFLLHGLAPWCPLHQPCLHSGDSDCWPAGWLQGLAVVMWSASTMSIKL